MLDYQVRRKQGKPTTIARNQTAAKAGSVTTQLRVSVARATQTPGTSASQQDCVRRSGKRCVEGGECHR